MARNAGKLRMAMDAGELRRAIEAHGRAVYSIALRITRDAGTAEEVAQDVFLELDRTAERMAGEEHVRFWLRRVAVHRATDALRRQARRPEASAAVWEDDRHGRWPDVDLTGSGTGVGADVVHLLETMVGSLPEAMRVAVVLRYGEEMTPEEISRLLEQPLPTVKSNLQRGLRLLRQKAAVTMKGYVRERA